MKIRWDSGKNKWLLEERNICFEMVVDLMKMGHHFGPYENPSSNYKDQEIIVVVIDTYAYVIPFLLDNDGTFFLKTMFPSRKWTKLYKQGMLK